MWLLTCVRHDNDSDEEARTDLLSNFSYESDYERKVTGESDDNAHCYKISSVHPKTDS